MSKWIDLLVIQIGWHFEVLLAEVVFILFYVEGVVDQF